MVWYVPWVVFTVYGTLQHGFDAYLSPCISCQVLEFFKVLSNLQSKKSGSLSECPGQNLFVDYNMSSRDTLAWRFSPALHSFLRYWTTVPLEQYMFENAIKVRVQFILSLLDNVVYLDMALPRKIMNLVLFLYAAQSSLSPAMQHVDGLLKHIYELYANFSQGTHSMKWRWSSGVNSLTSTTPAVLEDCLALLAWWIQFESPMP